MKQNLSKRILSMLVAMVMLVGLLPTAAIPAFALDINDIDAYESDYQYGYFLEDGTWVRLVYDWDDMDRVFQNLKSMDEYGYVTIKLMDDLSVYCGEDYTSDSYSIKSYEVSGPVSDWEDINIVFDFNGHTLNGTVEIDDVYSMANFINLTLLSGNQLTFTDSVGGGGINFTSKRHHDNNIAALHITSVGEIERGEGYNKEDPNSYPAKVTFNGGTYEMSDSIEYYHEGTRIEAIDYRGTVIADFVDVEINDGTFIANSGGVITTGGLDMCARELAAFGTVIESSYNFPAETYPSPGVVIPYEETGRTVINGGKFISDGYAVHHFDNSDVCSENGVFESGYYEYPYKGTSLAYLDGHYHMNYPTINGGYFEGQLGFTGLTYTYSEGNSDLNSRPVSEIIPEASIILGIDKDGNKITDVSSLNWKDLHDMQSCFVVPADSIKINTTPEGTSDPIKLTRTVKQSDTFEMSWTVPSYLEGEVVCQPMVTITRPKSNIEPKIYSDSKVTVNYSEYPNDVNVACELYLLAWGEALIFKQNYEVDVNRIYTATDGCIHCYAAGEDGWDEVVEGGSCSFKIYPKDYYELTDPDALEVYVNGDLVTPDGDGVYTVENVTEDLDIYCDGTGFTSYSNLTITANGKTVTEKIFDGGTYTFKTLAGFGATVPENSTFTGWKIGGKTYQPGETYTVPGGTEIAVNAVFTGLHTITVENGKAYADEAHTIPISAAAEDQVIYIVADPAPEGKVFGYWTEIEISSPGGDGWFGSYDSAQTTYTVYYSDVVLAPVYETQIDNIVINGMTKPSAGVAVDNSDYSYKWGCSVPANSGYSLGICYWYDITDGEPEFAMSSGDVFQIGHTYRFKAKINLYGDTILAAKEDISVALTGLDADSYTWTISEYSQIYENMVIYFEFTCEREEPDTALICPKGDGTSGNPFQITNIGELYWFAAFVNGTITADDITVEPTAVHAKLMNDITVNYDLLTEEGVLNDTSGVIEWTPIGLMAGYDGTFDGNGKTVSGIYCAPQDATKTFYGFFSHIDDGCVRNLTLVDSYVCAPAKNTAYTGGIAGQVYKNGTVENCHFDGTVTTAITVDSENKENYTHLEFGGIAGYVQGEVRDCTVRGLISGYGRLVGGIAAYVNGGKVSGCVNEATVENTRSDAGYYYTGGIAATMRQGTVRDCCNKSNASSGWISAGIVCHVEDQGSTVSRCWNEGEIKNGSGIVSLLKGNVQNCYNTGKVECGIVEQANSGSSITYCHNVGDADSIVSFIDSYATIENCYYLADSESDTIEGTTYKTADQFADGTVLALLDNGHWTQGEDDEYPVLGDAPGVTVSGMVVSFGKESEKTTVQLFPSGSGTPAFSITLTGTHAIYSFKGVEAGTYTMKVSKANHVTREYTVIVGNSPIPLDAKIHLLGDVTGDGRLRSNDLSVVYDHVSGEALIEDEYIFACADIDGNGRLRSNDVTKMYDHTTGDEPLW